LAAVASTATALAAAASAAAWAASAWAAATTLAAAALVEDIVFQSSDGLHVTSCYFMVTTGSSH
jgi:hypothetical protein